MCSGRGPGQSAFIGWDDAEWGSVQVYVPERLVKWETTTEPAPFSEGITSKILGCRLVQRGH